MAVKNTIPMLVDIYKNRNTASKTYGQYYGRVFARDGLNLKGFAKHLSHHGKVATYEMMSLVAIMRAQRNYGDIDFEVVNLVDHAVLLIDAPAPQSSTALKEELRKP